MLLDTVTPFSLSQFSCVSGGSHWCHLLLIVQHLTQLIDLTPYLVLCSKPNISATTCKLWHLEVVWDFSSKTRLEENNTRYIPHYTCRRPVLNACPVCCNFRIILRQFCGLGWGSQLLLTSHDNPLHLEVFGSVVSIEGF